MDFSEIIGYMTATAKGVQAIASVTSDAAVQEKTVELNGTIISLQSAIMQMQAEHQKCIDVKKSLEQEILKRENWDEEKDNYTLTEVSRGVRVYVENEGAESIYQRIWLCPKCFENNKKSIIQLQRAHPNPREYICHVCNSMYRVRPIVPKQE